MMEVSNMLLFWRKVRDGNMGTEWRGAQWVGCEKGKLPILVVVKSGHSGSENCTLSQSILILRLASSTNFWSFNFQARYLVVSFCDFDIKNYLISFNSL